MEVQEGKAEEDPLKVKKKHVKSGRTRNFFFLKSYNFK